VKAYGTSLGKKHPFPTDRVAERAQMDAVEGGGEKINLLPYRESKPPRTENCLVIV